MTIEITPQVIAAVSVAAFLIGLTKAGLGGGLGPLITAVMILTMPVEVALGILLPMLIVGDIFSIGAHWRKWDRRHVLILGAGAVVGVALGTLILTSVEPTTIQRIVGVVSLSFVAYRLFQPRLQATAGSLGRRSPSASSPLVPADLRDDLGRAKIVITNFDGLQPRSTIGSLPKLTKQLLTEAAYQETTDQMVRRVCRELGSSSKQILVLNDEAHHCYRHKPEDEDTTKLTGDDKQEAERRDQEARVWVSGLEAVQRKLGIKTVYDLSATPFFLAGSGYKEGTLFPWVVSDFSLIDAIESGVVKVPRVPVADDSVTAQYDQESFFVRHAYFTGGDKPYQRLQKTLRSDIDEDAWATLYSTISRPFLKPETGRIGVKVINHYGDEVMKVYEVG